MRSTDIDIDNMEFPNLLRILRDYAIQIDREYKNNLAYEGKNATRTLSDSVSIRIERGNAEIDVIFSAVDYFQYVEHGRKAGRFPNVDALRRWITVKPVIPREINGRLPTVDQLAYLIGRKIARDGIKEGLQLERTVFNANNMYVPLLEEALRKDFNDEYSMYLMDDINECVSRALI